MAKLYWVTGLSGAGKTTIGKLLFDHLKMTGLHTVFLDGDELRAILGVAGKAYSEHERKVLAFQYAGLCKLLVDQGVNVVCATISMFHDVRNWNRKNIENYCEIYLKVPEDVLQQRDQKGLYSKAQQGSESELVGLNREFEEPSSSDIVMINDGAFSVEEMFKNLIEKLMK